MELLAYAHAETGTGADNGVIKDGEAKRILSRIARTGDNNSRIKALDSFAKINEAERKQSAGTAEYIRDPHRFIAAWISVFPEPYGTLVAGLMALWPGNIGTGNCMFLVEPLASALIRTSRLSSLTCGSACLLISRTMIGKESVWPRLLPRRASQSPKLLPTSRGFPLGSQTRCPACLLSQRSN